MFTKEYLQSQYWDAEKSTIQIAEENNTYPNAVRRAILKYWDKLRNHSEAQSIVIENIHPTKGKNLSEEHKKKIADSLTNYWRKDG